MGPSGWAHVGPTHLVGGPTRGPSGWAQAKILGPKKSKNQKFSKSKSVLPKMSARFFYAGKRRPRPIWGPPGQFFPWAGKIQKLSKFCLFSLVGQWALFTRFGALAISQRTQGSNALQGAPAATCATFQATCSSLRLQGKRRLYSTATCRIWVKSGPGNNAKIEISQIWVKYEPGKNKSEANHNLPTMLMLWQYVGIVV